MIACTDVGKNYQLHKEEYEEAALRVLRSGSYILGYELRAFEEEFAEYLGVKYCIGLNNGTDALILAFRALGIGPGDEVIVPGNTYIATVLGITENGATPVFCEPDEYFNIDVTKIEQLITKNTKAIAPVHLYGQACNMEAIMEIAHKYDLCVIEDCAQSHGAAFNGQKTGTFGTIGCFSFYPTKPLGAFGDAGCVVTDNDELADKLRMLRNYGSKRKYVNESIGVNSRLDEIQAAMLRVGLKYLDEGNKIRQNIAMKYYDGIKNDQILLPKIAKGSSHVFHQFPVLCDSRDELKQYLESNGINTIIHYPTPPHLQQCYKELGYISGDFPITERYSRQELSLPMYTGIDNDIMRVVDIISKYGLI